MIIMINLWSEAYAAINSSRSELWSVLFVEKDPVFQQLKQRIHQRFTTDIISWSDFFMWDHVVFVVQWMRYYSLLSKKDKNRFDDIVWRIKNHYTNSHNYPVFLQQITHAWMSMQLVPDKWSNLAEIAFDAHRLQRVGNQWTTVLAQWWENNRLDLMSRTDKDVVLPFENEISVGDADLEMVTKLAMSVDSLQAELDQATSAMHAVYKNKSWIQQLARSAMTLSRNKDTKTQQEDKREQEAVSKYMEVLDHYNLAVNASLHLSGVSTSEKASVIGYYIWVLLNEYEQIDNDPVRLDTLLQQLFLLIEFCKALDPYLINQQLSDEQKDMLQTIKWSHPEYVMEWLSVVISLIVHDDLRDAIDQIQSSNLIPISQQWPVVNLVRSDAILEKVWYMPSLTNQTDATIVSHRYLGGVGIQEYYEGKIPRPVDTWVSYATQDVPWYYVPLLHFPDNVIPEVPFIIDTVKGKHVATGWYMIEASPVDGWDDFVQPTTDAYTTLTQMLSQTTPWKIMMSMETDLIPLLDLICIARNGQYAEQEVQERFYSLLEEFEYSVIPSLKSDAQQLQQYYDVYSWLIRDEWLTTNADIATLYNFLKQMKFLIDLCSIDQQDPQKRIMLQKTTLPELYDFYSTNSWLSSLFVTRGIKLIGTVAWSIGAMYVVIQTWWAPVIYILASWVWGVVWWELTQNAVRVVLDKKLLTVYAQYQQWFLTEPEALGILWLQAWQIAAFSGIMKAVWSRIGGNISQYVLAHPTSPTAKVVKLLAPRLGMSTKEYIALMIKNGTFLQHYIKQVWRETGEELIEWSAEHVNGWLWLIFTIYFSLSRNYAEMRNHNLLWAQDMLRQTMYELQHATDHEKNIFKTHLAQQMHAHKHDEIAYQSLTDVLNAYTSVVEWSDRHITNQKARKFIKEHKSWKHWLSGNAWYTVAQKHKRDAANDFGFVVDGVRYINADLIHEQKRSLSGPDYYRFLKEFDLHEVAHQFFSKMTHNISDDKILLIQNYLWTDGSVNQLNESFAELASNLSHSVKSQDALQTINALLIDLWYKPLTHSADFIALSLVPGEVNTDLQAAAMSKIKDMAEEKWLSVEAANMYDWNSIADKIAQIGRIPWLRQWQIRAFDALANFYRTEKDPHVGIKMPTGTGKSRIMALLTKELWENTLITTVSSDLYGQMIDELHTVWFDKTVLTINMLPWNNVVEKISYYLAHISVDQQVLLITYSSLLELKKQDEGVFRQFVDLFPQLLIDEAHKALGDNTIDALSDAISDIQEPEWSTPTRTVRFTATPNNIQSRLSDNVDLAIDMKLSEAIELWDIVGIQPSFTGTAYLDTDYEGRITQSFLDENIGKFVDEQGKPIVAWLTDQYLSLRKSDGSLPPCGSRCVNLAHAEYVKRYHESRWIRSVLVTSKSTLSMEEALAMSKSWEIDEIIVVGKVEWWNAPWLEVISNYFPTQSERVALQWLWRGTRKNDAIDKQFFYLIEPNERRVHNLVSSQDRSQDNSLPETAEKSSSESTQKKDKQHYQRGDLNSVIPNSMQQLYLTGELDETYLQKHWVSLPEIAKQYTAEEIGKWLQEKYGYTLKERSSLTRDEKQDIKLNWNWLYALSSWLWIKWDPSANNTIYVKFMNTVWIPLTIDMMSIRNTTKYSAEEIKKWLQEKYGYSLEERANLSAKNKDALTLFGKSLTALSSDVWVSWRPSSDLTIYVEFMNKIWFPITVQMIRRKKNTDVLTIDQIKNILNATYNYTPEKRWSLSVNERRAIKVLWKSLIGISADVWIEWNPISSSVVYVKLLNKLWIPITLDMTSARANLEITIEDIKKWIANYNYSLDKWANLTVADRKNITVQWKKMTILSTYIWIKWSPITDKYVYIEFMNKVWVPLTIDMMSIRNTTKYSAEEIKKWLQEKYGYSVEERANLPVKDKSSIKLFWKTLMSLSSDVWVKWDPIKDIEVYVIFMNKIGFVMTVEMTGLKKYTAEDIRKWLQEKYGYSLEEWANLSSKKIKGINLYTRSIVALSSDIWMEWSARDSKKLYIKFMNTIWIPITMDMIKRKKKKKSTPDW